MVRRDDSRCGPIAICSAPSELASYAPENTSQQVCTFPFLWVILDALNDAINAGVKVSFHYFENSGTKRRKLKNGGEPYIAASNNVIKVNNAFERLGAVFIITSAISMFLQVKDLTDIRDFLSDFRISSNKYTSQIKGNINNDSCCRTVAFGIIVSIFSYGVA